MHSPEFKNRIPAVYAGSLRYKLHAIKQAFETDHDYIHIAIRSQINLILIDLLLHHNYRSSVVNNTCRLSNMLAVYDYIDQHLSEDLTLNAIAKVAMVSPNYLSHLFKRTNGMSLWTYINTKRIEKAEQLLTSQTEKYTILEIATMCGFNNTVNFNKAFKKQKGISPNTFRKTQQQP